jgi:outer membrane protein TolC
VLAVWTSHQNVQTAAQRVRASRDLLASAEQSAQVAQGRYKEGVGSILDLLVAQSALSSARAQEVQARADWLLALASLAHDTGSLGPAEGEQR